MSRLWIPWTCAALLVASMSGPGGAAGPTTCDDPCTIDASVGLADAPGFSPAVAILANATNVTWHAKDSIQHKMLDVGTAEPCFGALAQDGSDSAGVTFAVLGGALVATDTSMNTATCGNAKGTPEGGFVLAYKCLFHLTMNGALVVQPE